MSRLATNPSLRNRFELRMRLHMRQESHNNEQKVEKLDYATLLARSNHSIILFISLSEVPILSIA